MTWRMEDVERLTQATGRRLLRVGAAGDNQIELVFEKRIPEQSELLVTVPLFGDVMVGRINLDELEQNFGRKYGVGI